VQASKSRIGFSVCTVGLTKPRREQGESSRYYNRRVRERDQLFKTTLGELREDETMRGATTDARRAVYERSLDAQQMERAGKLSSGSVRIERQIEALRGDAFASLRSMPEYRTLSAKDQKAVRKLVDEELERFMARVPYWTRAELAKTAVEARE
jgi:hypothetical protein